MNYALYLFYLSHLTQHIISGLSLHAKVCDLDFVLFTEQFPTIICWMCCIRDWNVYLFLQATTFLRPIFYRASVATVAVNLTNLQKYMSVNVRKIRCLCKELGGETGVTVGFKNKGYLKAVTVKRDVLPRTLLKTIDKCKFNHENLELITVVHTVLYNCSQLVGRKRRRRRKRRKKKRRRSRKKKRYPDGQSCHSFHLHLVPSSPSLQVPPQPSMCTVGWSLKDTPWNR